MVKRAAQPAASVAQIAREHGIKDTLIFKWLRLWQNAGRISRRLPATVATVSSPALLPVEVISAPTQSGEHNATLRAALVRADEKRENEERDIAHLRAQLEQRRQMVFGTCSEKRRRQMEKADTGLTLHEQAGDRLSGRGNDPPVPRRLLRQSRHRRPRPEHLPREMNRLEPVETGCPKCGNDLTCCWLGC